MSKKISELTSATAIADADLVVIVQSGSSKKATGAVLKETVLGAVDTAAAQVVLEDANLVSVRDGTDSKSITGLALITSGKDSDFPSYKNLVTKNTVASPNNQIDITFDNLQIGRIHKTGGSYLAFNVETAGNWDTGTAAEPVNGWVYVWMMAKIDGTCTPFYSLSATAPTLPSGYVYSRLVTFIRNASSNFAVFSQVNDVYSRATATMQTAGTSTTYADTTTISLANAAPDLSLIKAYLGEVNQSTSGVLVALTTNASLLEGFYLRIGTADITVSFVLHRSGTVFKYKTAATGSVVIFLTGYLLNI